MNKCIFCGRKTENKRFCNLNCCYIWQRKNGGFKRGVKLSEISKQKIRDGVPRGDKHPSKNIEWRENLSRKLKGKPKSLEHRKNISIGLKGIKKTLKHRKALSIANTGVKKPTLSIQRMGKGNPAWKGGRTKDANGYWVLYMPKHPYACQGKVKEHRYVVEQSIGRYLLPNEAVHHIDFDKTNNKIENLFLMKKGQHSKLHRDLELKVRQMYKDNLLKFSRDKGCYE